MSLAGYLSEYSLAEIFHFVQQGNKTGVLSIEPEPGSTRSASDVYVYYLAFQSGRIMSVATGHSLKHQGLLKLMQQRRWLTPEQSNRVEVQANVLNQPLGTYLKSLDILNSEQLTLLFNSQVIATTCKLFEINSGKFSFNPQASLIYGEMTGLSLTAQEVALLGLRMLKNWSGLTAKLPTPEFALQRFFAEPVGVKLDTQESKVWKLAIGELSIRTIAQELGLEVEKVQQIGFRLSSIGLVQEVTLEPKQPPVNKAMDVPTPICVGGGDASTAVSASFLSNLMGFLKKKKA
jgi:Domain of unknown function (DUF4388)